jgi:hypothetical protein
LRVVTVSAGNCKSGRYGNERLKCVCCKRAVVRGERVLYHQGYGKCVCHMECLVGLVGSEPEFHDYETDVDRMLRDLAENGL